MNRPIYLSRRRFFHLAGLSIAGAAISACNRASAPTYTATPVPTQMPTSTPTPAPSPIPAGKAIFKGGSADSWAWQKQVSGQIEGGSCGAVEVTANKTTIQATLEGNHFMANIPIEEGDNEVTAACQPNGPSSEPITYTGRMRNVPRSVIDIKIENGRMIVDSSRSQPAPVNGSPVTTYAWSARVNNPAPVSIVSPDALAGKSLAGDINAPRLEIAVPEADGEYYLSLQVTDEAGHSDTSTTYFGVTGGKPRLDDWTWQNTAWVENAVVYGVIPFLFGRPAFKRITERLDKLQELGVNALWLAPINVSPPGDYGYAVVDYFNLRKEYGMKEDFRQLVDAAHQRGIRVLMDFVPNHSSDQHPYFLSAQKQGKDSPYWDFYDRDEAGAPTHYFTWTNLPNLNYENPEVRNWITEAFSYWVREFNVDGFRVDACWGVKQRRPDFWPEWRAELKRIKPDLLLLAEASAHDDYYFTDGFDAAYDWTDQLGHWAWERVFEDKNLLSYNLNTALTNNRKGFHSDALIFRFLNNNDTGDRFITRYGPEMNKVASTLLLTLPGIPCVYTGDEVGAEYSPYTGPQPLSWEDKDGLFDFYKNLIALRRGTPALRSRKWQVVEITPQPKIQFFGFLRDTDDGAAPVLVLLNFSDQPAKAEVKLPEEYAKFASAGKLKDLLSGKTVSFRSQLTVDMPPMGARILAA